jgi:hypothetical protein
MDCRFIQWCLLNLAFTQCTNSSNACIGASSYKPSVHPTILFSSLFFLGLDPQIHTIFSFWHMVFLHPWDLEMRTKTCSTIRLSHWSCCHESPKSNSNIWHMRHVRYRRPLARFLARPVSLSPRKAAMKWARMGLGRSAQAGRPDPFPGPFVLTLT